MKNINNVNIFKDEFKHMCQTCTALEIIIRTESGQDKGYYGVGVNVLIEPEPKITVTDLVEDIPISIDETALLSLYDLDLKQSGILKAVQLGMPGFNVVKTNIVAFDTAKIPNEVISYRGKDASFTVSKYLLLFEYESVYWGVTGTVYDPVNNNCGLMLMELKKNPQLYKFDSIPDIQEMITRCPALLEVTRKVGQEIIRNPARWKVIETIEIRIIIGEKSYVESRKQFNLPNKTI